MRSAALRSASGEVVAATMWAGGSWIDAREDTASLRASVTATATARVTVSATATGSGSGSERGTLIVTANGIAGRTRSGIATAANAVNAVIVTGSASEYTRFFTVKC